MKERPILMSEAMVRAILAGRKTQTRRVVKGVQRNNCLPLKKATKSRHGIETHVIDAPVHGLCPYGIPGDRLWVKETFSAHGAFGSAGRICYAADMTDGKEPHGLHWRPSIFMPRAASRITLEVVSVRVERLSKISAADALAEGISKELVRAQLGTQAARCKTKPEHWIHGWDESQSFCCACAEKKVGELLKETPGADYCVDGGWGTEGDSTPFCETCHARLENSLTDYGASEEFRHFDEHGVNLKSADDCLSFLEAVASQLWTPGDHGLHLSEFEKKKMRERNELMHRLCYRVLWESINGPGSWAENPWVWVVEFKRV